MENQPHFPNQSLSLSLSAKNGGGIAGLGSCEPIIMGSLSHLHHLDWCSHRGF